MVRLHQAAHDGTTSALHLAVRVCITVHSRGLLACVVSLSLPLWRLLRWFRRSAHRRGRPLTPTPLTQSNVFLGGAAGAEPGIGGFRFAAGTYNIMRLGAIAGAGNAAWGVITDAGSVYTAAMLSTGNTTITGPFAIWITEALPVAGSGVIYTSDRRTGAVAIGARGATTQQQHAVFTNGTGVGNLGGLSTDMFGTIINSTGVGATYYVGMEDLSNGGRGFATSGMNPISDRDYQDVLIRIQAVPEPATIGLMGFGLLALAGAAKRRKA